MNNTQQQEWKVAAGKDAFSSPRGLHAPGCARGQHRGWGQREEKNFIRCSWLHYIAYTNAGMSSGVARAVLAHFREYIPLPYYAGPQIKFRSDDDEQDDENKFTFDQAHLKIYPNPASDRIHVEWDGDLYQPYRIDVINAYGLRIESLDEIFGQSVTFEATDWPNGIYLIVSNDGSGQMQTGKVLILKN